MQGRRCRTEPERSEPTSPASEASPEVGSSKPQSIFDGRRLTCAVRSKEAADFTVTDVQAYVLHRVKVAELLLRFGADRDVAGCTLRNRRSVAGGT
jgi:hypothetical protein